MPYVEVITRQPLTRETKALLAKNLSDAICKIEVGMVTEGALLMDWMWFHVLPESDWAVGGEFGDKYVRGRTMCYANIIVPEAFLNHGLQIEAIAVVTQVIRDALGAGPDDDGTGIWVAITEVSRGMLAAAGRPVPLTKLIEIMNGYVSPERRAEMQARFDGYDRMMDHFSIPHQ